MHILLTNDDGIFAPGLAALYEKLKPFGKITVVAPQDVQSGAGHSISLKAIRCEYLDIVGKFSGYSVDGSPADCVKLAVNELISPDDPIDLVISGMNHGANVGINVFYSGTVAGAIEGGFYGFPAIAVSAAFDEEPMKFSECAEYACTVIKQLLPVSPGQVVSINIPRLSKQKPKGIRIAAQSTHGFEECYESKKDQNGEPIYYLTGGIHLDPEGSQEWSDTQSVAEGYITITSLRLDLTDLEGNKKLAQKEYTLNDHVESI